MNMEADVTTNSIYSDNFIETKLYQFVLDNIYDQNYKNIIKWLSSNINLIIVNKRVIYWSYFKLKLFIPLFSLKIHKFVTQIKINC